MLEHIGHDDYAKKIKGGVESVLREGKCKTRDLGGFQTTRMFTQAVVDSI